MKNPSDPCVCSIRSREIRPRASMLAMSRRVVIGIVAVAAVAAPGAALAVSKSGKEPGCKVVSVTESQPEYSSQYDESGTVIVTTTKKCRGKLQTTKTVKIVTRDLPGNGVAPAKP